MAKQYRKKAITDNKKTVAHDEEYHKQRFGWNWIPLLLIPLLLLGAWALWPRGNDYDQSHSTVGPANYAPNSTSVSSNNSGKPVVGVGGGNGDTTSGTSPAPSTAVPSTAPNTGRGAY